MQAERFTLTARGRAAIAADVEPRCTDSSYKSLRRDARTWPMEFLVATIEAVQTAVHVRFCRWHRPGPRDMDELVYGVDMNTERALCSVLRHRADAARIRLVEDLTAALDTGDVRAFRRIARRWRRTHPVVRRFFLAWNGAAVPGFAEFVDVEPEEFTDAARRLRLADEAHGGPTVDA